MSRRVISRLVLAGVIATLLAFAHPVRAEAAELASPRLLWDWLAGLWETGISALEAGSQPAIDKDGPGVASTGVASTGTTTQGGSTSSTPPPTGSSQGDAGPGIDPNG